MVLVRRAGQLSALTVPLNFLPGLVTQFSSPPCSPFHPPSRHYPQVDLGAASIRPGHSAAWFDKLRGRVLAGVGASSAEVAALSGTWQHDLDQTNLLPADKVRGGGGA